VDFNVSYTVFGSELELEFGNWNLGSKFRRWVRTKLTSEIFFLDQMAATLLTINRV
jgi:hypothetical protein